MNSINRLYDLIESTYQSQPTQVYDDYNIKRGLRNPDGTPVMAGITAIGDVRGYYMQDGERIAVDGKLKYRGINVTTIVENCQKEKRFGFEEVAFLLIFGFLPSRALLAEFNEVLANYRTLPDNFPEDMILKAPSPNIMIKLARSVLALYTYDPNPDDISLRNLLRQSIELIARLPTMAVYGYYAKISYYDNQSLILHHPQEHLSTAENFLYLLRADNQYTNFEAEILDLLLMLHAEHGGGNNSTFATRVVSSTGTDTYSAIAAAIGSLKGPKHGGANQQVMGMIDYFKTSLHDITSESEVKDCIAKIIKKEAYDHKGLIYGMGHAVYTKSDPRAVLLKEKAEQMAKIKGFEEEFELYNLIEKLTPEVFAEIKGDSKMISANVDLYSGFVYKMLGIPSSLYTPLFAISRIVGWCAHRIEEVITCNRIIRPGYKSIYKENVYVPIDERE
jgi:citrate synthase